MIVGMRIKYKDKSETFTEDALKSKEPFGQFEAWFNEARNTPGVLEPNAMCLATATKWVNIISQHFLFTYTERRYRNCNVNCACAE